MTSGASPTDRVLSEDEVLAIARRHLPAARRLTGVDESGRKGRAYFIDEAFVIKTHRPGRLRGRAVEEFETSLEKEEFLLAQTAGAAGVRTPTPLGHGYWGGLEYICMTRMRGVNLRQAGLDHRRLGAVLSDVGGMLARIHALPQAKMQASGFFGPSDAAGVTEAFARTVRALASAARSLPEDYRISLDPDEAATAAIEMLPRSFEAVVIHSNPAPEHVYVDPLAGRFNGLIDLADACFGHPAFDLRPWRAPADRDAVISGYARLLAPDEGFLSAMKAAMIGGELASLTRMRQAPEVSEAVLRELLS